MKRRSFVKKSAFTAFSIAAFGSISWDGKAFTGDTPTTTDILGPFYRPGAPARNNLIPPGVTGDIMNLSGKIYSKDRAPLANVLVEAWQCDSHEYYDNTSDDFLFRGAVKTDAAGKYSFKTIIPVPYKAGPDVWRPAHIHLRISSPDAQDLITQIYFKGDAYLDNDASSSSPQAVNRILEMKKNKANEHEVVFDVVLDKAYQLNDEGYKKICGLYDLKDRKVEFYREDDLLFAKINGQLQVALIYKGNNTFEDNVGFVKAAFKLVEKGEPQVSVTMKSFVDDGKVFNYEGERYLKYPK